MKRGADVGTDHHLVIGKIKKRLARLVKKKVGRICYNTKNLREGDLRGTFVIRLQNRFESLYIEEGNEEASDESEQIRVQQAEIKLKSRGVRSRMSIWMHVKRYLEKGKRKKDSGHRWRH